MPNITQAEYRKLLDAQERLDKLRDQQLMASFIEQFQHNLAVYAAATPMAEWPTIFVDSFNAAASQMPMAAATYREHHKR